MSNLMLHLSLASLASLASFAGFLALAHWCFVRMRDGHLADACFGRQGGAIMSFSLCNPAPFSIVVPCLPHSDGRLARLMVTRLAGSLHRPDSGSIQARFSYKATTRDGDDHSGIVVGTYRAGSRFTWSFADADTAEGSATLH